MEEKPFADQSSKPTEAALKVSLGRTFVYYEKVNEIAGSFKKDWTFTKGSGWILKIHTKKKALLYLIPLQGNFKISLTIRQSEREVFLQDKDLYYLHDAITSAKKYPEGFALQFLICDENDFCLFESFFRKLIAARL
jgi:hypothetical protein